MPTPLESINGRTTRAEFGARTEADRFEHWFHKEHPTKFPDGRIDLIFGDLKTGRFWTPLSLLDGPAKGALQNPNGGKDASVNDYEEARLASRRWALDTFTKPELDTIVDLVINLALEPERITAPGHERGHSTLLSHMVDKPGSIFADEITPEGRRRLINGAFWEELGYAVGGAPLRAEDILVNHGSELDPSLAGNGVLFLYDRNRNLTTALEKIDIDMGGFSTQSLDTYLSFIEKVAREIALDGDPAVPDHYIDQLVTPYILALVEPASEDDRDLRFGPKYDDEKQEYVVPADSYHTRLQHPLVQQVLSISKENRRVFGERLAGLLTAEPEIYGDVTLDVIEAIGGETSDKVLQTTLSQVKDYEVGNIRYLLQTSNSKLKNRGLELLDQRTPQDQEE